MSVSLRYVLKETFANLLRVSSLLSFASKVMLLSELPPSSEPTLKNFSRTAYLVGFPVPSIWSTDGAGCVITCMAIRLLIPVIETGPEEQRARTC